MSEIAFEMEDLDDLGPEIRAKVAKIADRVMSQEVAKKLAEAFRFEDPGDLLHPSHVDINPSWLMTGPFDAPLHFDPYHYREPIADSTLTIMARNYYLPLVRDPYGFIKIDNCANADRVTAPASIKEKAYSKEMAQILRES